MNDGRGPEGENGKGKRSETVKIRGLAVVEFVGGGEWVVLVVLVEEEGDSGEEETLQVRIRR